MLGRSRSVSDPRWSPSGALIAWIDAFDGRADVVVAPSDSSGPPVVVTAECGAAGRFAWVDDERLVVPAADGRLALVRAVGGVVRFLTRDGRALSPAVSVRGEVACAIERDDACDVATVPLDGSAMARTGLERRLRLGPGLVTRRWGPRVAGVGPAEHAVARVACHAAGRARREADGGRRRRRVQPAPVLPGRQRASRGCATARSWSTVRSCRRANSIKSAPNPRGRRVSGRSHGRPTVPSSRGAATSRDSGGS